MEYIGIEKFGTLFLNNIAQSRSSRPWWSNNYPGTLSERGKGTIPTLPSDGTVQLRDTQRGSEIQWIHIADKSKHIYISDQVLVTKISWNYLNERNMIYGTPVTIDGKKYKLRVPTGGEAKNTNNPGTIPTDNEWDTLVQNTANIIGLPKPTTEDLINNNTYGQLDGAHNQLWNWWGVSTICQELSNNSVDTKMTRGDSSAVGFTGYATSYVKEAFGWRPVLEYIETDPPEKPEIIYPVGTNEKPEVVMDDPIIIKTEFNNPSGEFNTMPVRVMDMTTDAEIKYAISSSLDYWITYPLILGHLYRVSLSHINTAKQESEVATTYFIYGQLNKYKLSEPITVKQYDKLKSYTGGETLEMKPQTFPETENSKVRLVPKTMNSIQAGKTTTTKELEFTTATKTPVIGDRLIKDNEIYSVAGLEQGVAYTNIDKTVLTRTSVGVGKLAFGNSLGSKTYTYKGKFYVAIYDEKVKVFEIDMATGDYSAVMVTDITSEKNFSLVGFDDKLVLVASEGTSLTFARFDITKRQTRYSSIGTGHNTRYLDMAYNNDTKQLGVVLKASKPGETTYIITAYRFSLTDFETPNMAVLENKTIEDYHILDQTSNPTICYTHSIDNNSINIVYAKETSYLASSLVEVKWKDGSVTVDNNLWNIPSKPNDIKMHEQYISDVDNKPSKAILVAYRNTSSNTEMIITLLKGSSGGYVVRKLASPDYTVVDMRITRDREHGYILLLRSYNNGIFKYTTKTLNGSWSTPERLLALSGTSSEQVLDIAEFNPYAYGTYPGIIYTEYNTTEQKATLNLKSDYTMEKPKANKVILDKPITAQTGDKIKFLDYDIEVKAGEETATITPTDITNDYYEYEAEFEKKQEERKVTVVGRNSKLTTLYYYNY
ncbi:hypothetical protein EXN65_18010 [Clostridium botulinum]|uniref:Uncharacterized protein n=1 Tax=Clostridium botulinum TaxID=1491 RepID=A0A846I199_CLOBO|nr:hypothetical protein [Clostridium botulinum]EDT87389.1 conserved hypothetical protein [Clostridium botulinum Bf]MBY6756435.1 hypothetical protein [Clostridium botulinum]MBY6881886.1 hypothetical protein [Clostridium botulinum]MBY6889050.1 hypothetical protein [Clostridium botulinum]NEZ88158.1 hypothetical protein [Clostridium botulinum]